MASAEALIAALVSPTKTANNMVAMQYILLD